MARPEHQHRGRGGRQTEKPEFDQKTITIRRVTRVVKGGRRFSFSAVIAAGDRLGRVGLGVGKAADVSLAIEKGFKDARKHMFKLALTKDSSLPYDVSAKFSSSQVRLAPAPGRGLSAGSAARIILELAGVRNVSAKFISRSKNKLNNARAAMKALEHFVQK
ncbi:MAG: 30S ribosomal protein S5 [Patescibacteria group bacterium]